MSKVVLDISMSLDGYVAGPNQTLEQGLGEGGERLHEWVVAVAAWRESHNLSGGEKNVDNDVMAEILQRIGATVMGRRMFSGEEGPWESDPNADAWWGDEPPFHHPVFILTHHALYRPYMGMVFPHRPQARLPQLFRAMEKSARSNSVRAAE